MTGLVWLASCGSTNDEAWRRVEDPGVRAVGADEQTSGRGRRGRVWHSPLGCGLYLSWIARPAFGPEHAGALPLLAGLCVAELANSLGVTATLKWPNDVLVRGRKLAGVLGEARIADGRMVAVVGIGLNLRSPPDGYPPEVPGIALESSLAAIEVATRLLERLDGALSRLPTATPTASVVERWMALGPVPGTRMRQGNVEGTYAGLAPDGALLLETANGRVGLHAGEVEHQNDPPPQEREPPCC
jgi:BirA family biotin operon repressor/biotin-[acetyl-CoA-carboxylase] ligase